jgi:DNA mismatch repair protein MutS2
MKPIYPATAESLQIPKVLGIVGRRCRSELGVAVLSELMPAKDLVQLSSRQALLRDVLGYRELEGEFPWDNHVVPVAGCIEEAKSSALLTGEELTWIRTLLALGMKVKGEAGRVRERFPELAQIGRRIKDFSEELEALGVLDEDGRLYDHASPVLRDLRVRLENLRGATRKTGQALLNDPATSGMLQDRVLSLRSGRFVVLVRSEHASVYPGIVTDRSSSGNSFYVEPYKLAALNNKLAVALEEERQEELRILRKLTLHVIEKEGAIREAEFSLGSLDLLCAEAEMVEKMKWHLPELSATSNFRFCRLVHPLLGEKAVPIEIACGADFRILVITGPNTGGKTVALKTAGVAVLLAWLGLPVPAAEGSMVGDIESVFVDVGDEQSIEQNLSTFSAHVNNIVSILKAAGSGSLVLLDELGSGTDPQEGAALGIALLEAFKEKASLVLATTHHNPIKSYALVSPGVETASMEFDPVSLGPTFSLLMGVPGKSNALLIAERLGMPRSVIDRAKSSLSGEDISVEELIGQLQEKRSSLEKAARELTAERGRLAETRMSLENRKANLDAQRENLLKEADHKAEEIVKEAQEAARDLLKGLEKSKTVSAAHRKMGTDRAKLERIRNAAELREERRIERQSVKVEGVSLKPGDAVQLVGSSVKGIVERVSEDRAILVAGSFHMEVPLGRLKKSGESPAKAQSPISVRTTRPTGIPSSIMVRGMTVDEALPDVERYLDQAYRAGYDQVTVIHGRGTGTLRKVVQELLKSLPYVREYRLGDHGEGGYGVTIVTFAR